MDELTTKLNEAELKAKDFEEKLRLREKQALEVSFVISYFWIHLIPFQKFWYMFFFSGKAGRSEAVGG